MILAGISLAVKPSFVFEFIESNSESTLLYYFAILVRILLGILFILSSKQLKHPGVIRFMGYLFVLISIAFLVIGQERFQNLLLILILEMKPFAFISGVLSILFGGYLLYVTQTEGLRMSPS